MPANSPQEMAEGIGQGIDKGNLDGVMALYEPNACLVPQPGQLLQGHVAIREGIAAFIALNPAMTGESRTVVQADDLAIVYTNWTLSGKTPEGDAVNMSGQSTDVMRSQPDGTWLCVIDNPFGGV